MAIREVRIMGDDILEKQCKPVTKMTMRTKILIEDMLDTMYEKYGVGLAAPQVGVLKQIVVIDVGEGPIVTRPNYVKVRALNEEMEEVELEGEGLLARAFCHEIDHLAGHMYVERVEDGLHDVEPPEEEVE